MALKPQNLLDKLYDNDLSEVARLERQIDEKLKQLFKGGTVSVQLNEDSINVRVQNELVRRYTNAGWSNVKFQRHSAINQFDTSYYNLSMPYAVPDKIPYDDDREPPCCPSYDR